eukprot:Phypoly_transcript_10761.p1 GENE.Phypoly_transcript_10761~~Phypoly_transcript_10761.p1  ORF type:complete len:283 (+),score=33.66 Phypoly_transcript_10761:83-931(+)
MHALTRSPLDLSSLDPFIVARVLDYFTALDVVNCSVVNWEWHTISQSPSLWYQLYLRDFGNYSSTFPPSLDHTSVDWKKKYAFATSIYILRNFTLGDNNNRAQKMCWIGMMLTKQDKSYLSAISRYPLYNQSIYCWNVYIKRLGQIICMSVVDMKPQPLYENPIVKIDGVCFTYSIHDRDSFETLKTNIAHKKDSLKDKNVVIIALTYNTSPTVIPPDEGRQLATQTQADFYDVDLRSYAGLDESFIYLLENIYKSKPLHNCIEDGEGIVHKKRKKGKCIIS